ncbi:MAG TPA: sialidase family protein [Gaiellaceae bacterium]
MRAYVGALAALAVLFVLGPAATGASGPPQGTQTNGAFAASYAAANVASTSVTTQKTSCYRPQVFYDGALPPEAGYPGGGSSPCPGATTGEQTTNFDTQDAAAASNPVSVVKDHSESDIRVDPTDSRHLIGQSKWFVNAEGYNHLLGFYESRDGGSTWDVQGHVPGYEGWTDNTDPVGAFDPWGNFYSLVLAYSFYYDKAGNHKYNNGSNQTNATVPPEAVAVSVRPHGATTASDWKTKLPNGQPDYVMTAKNANTSDPDKQWIVIDTNPTSRCYGTVYAMYTVFVLNPSVVFVSTATAQPSGTHTPWTTPQELPTVNGKRWDSYLLPHIAPDGTVYTPVTNGPPQQGFSNADVNLVSSSDCGGHWTSPKPIVSGVNVPTYQNTTFREGILDTFGVGSHPVNGHYPLYLAYEDASGGVSNIWLRESDDGGASWTEPVLVNDNATPVDELQPNLTVDSATGKVAVAFYDRRLDCPAAATAANGLAYDPNDPVGAGNYCVNTAVQFYRPDLTPIGHNVRLSADTWDPQLNAPHPACICSASTFIGDYFGIDSDGTSIYTTSVSTYDGGANPWHYQQQWVAKLAIP